MQIPSSDNRLNLNRDVNTRIYAPQTGAGEVNLKAIVISQVN
jgi:hypothetical protein